MIAAWLLAATLVVTPQQPKNADADLQQAMTFIDNGDFVPAEEVLRAVTATLEGQPSKMRDLANAYLYLAIAQLEQDRPKEASRNFFEARRRNRSLTLSQSLLGTREIFVIQHTGCGLHGDEDALRARVTEATGTEPPWSLGAFEDVDSSVRRQLEILRSTPTLLGGETARGFVYEVETGRLREVD